MSLHVQHVTRPKAGEQANGDAAIVREEGGATLFAVVDALGHGDVAAAASSAATRYLSQAPLKGPADVMTGLHRALRGTRGAGAMIGLFRGGVLEGCSVGNIALRAVGTRVAYVLTPGILGSHHARLRCFRTSLQAADRFAVFSDGLDATLALREADGLTLRQARDELFARYASDHDDATLLLAEVTS